MKRLIFVAIVILTGAIGAYANTPPEVTNVVATQRLHTAFVDVQYDIQDIDGDNVYVTLWYSLDGGITWDNECTTVSGDVGSGVVPLTGLTATWDAGADEPDLAIQQFAIRVYADDQATGSTLTADLVSYWKLDNGYTDSVGSSDSTPHGSVVYEPNGKINGCYTFANDGYLGEIFDPAIGDATTGTVSAWVRMTAPENGGVVFAEGHSSNSEVYFMLNVNGSSGIGVYIKIGNSHHTGNTQTALDDGNWHHVVWMADGSNMKFYVDGSEVVLTWYYGDDSSVWFANTAGNSHAIGVLDRASDFNYFDGEIDEVAIWSRALSADEVTELWNSDAGLQYPFY